MTTQPFSHARLCAMTFVLGHGGEIGPNAIELTAFFTQALHQFETGAGAGWYRMDGLTQAHVAMTAADHLLTELMPSFNESLMSHGRFEWRQRIARFFLGYMNMQAELLHSDSIDALIDRYILVHNAIQTTIDTRGKLLDIDDWDEADTHEPYIYCPN